MPNCLLIPEKRGAVLNRTHLLPQRFAPCEDRARRHEPAVADLALGGVVARGTVDEEVRVFAQFLYITKRNEW